MRQLRVRTYTPAMVPPPVNVGLAVSLNGLSLAELSGCQPHYGTCADCFSGIIMSLLSWGRAAFPSHSRGLCQHHIQHFYIQRPDIEITSMPNLLYPIPPPPLLWICPETQFKKK